MAGASRSRSPPAGAADAWPLTPLSVGGAVKEFPLTPHAYLGVAVGRRDGRKGCSQTGVEGRIEAVPVPLSIWCFVTFV